MLVSSLLLSTLVLSEMGTIKPLFPLEIAYADIGANFRSNSPATTIVTNQNFLDYFKLTGSTAYDTTTGILTLTPDVKDQSGTALLANKIDMEQSFTLQGSVNLGNKNQTNGGADGIGFIFSPDNLTNLGLKGGSVGMGGLEQAFGFKLDTFYNKNEDPLNYKFKQDPATFGDAEGKGHAFGAYYSSDKTGIVSTYDDNDAPAQQISEPTTNTFTPITIYYDGSTKVMSVTYEGKIWQKNLSDWIDTTTGYTFGLTGSTGAQTNLQQFKIETFSYTTTGTIQTKYVDKATGKEILPGETFTGKKGDEQKNLQTQAAAILALGYTFDSFTTSVGSTYIPETDSIFFTEEDQLITFYYTKNPEKTTTDSHTSSQEQEQTTTTAISGKQANAGRATTRSTTTSTDSFETASTTTTQQQDSATTNTAITETIADNQSQSTGATGPESFTTGSSEKAAPHHSNKKAAADETNIQWLDYSLIKQNVLLYQLRIASDKQKENSQLGLVLQNLSGRLLYGEK